MAILGFDRRLNFLVLVVLAGGGEGPLFALDFVAVAAAGEGSFHLGAALRAAAKPVTVERLFIFAGGDDWLRELLLLVLQLL